MAFVSWRFAGATSIARGMPYFSTAIWILMPRIFLPPSMPRAKQLGAERQERLSGSGLDWRNLRVDSQLLPNKGELGRAGEAAVRHHGPNLAQPNVGKGQPWQM